jgi:hypothetical protein
LSSKSADAAAVPASRFLLLTGLLLLLLLLLCFEDGCCKIAKRSNTHDKPCGL